MHSVDKKETDPCYLLSEYVFLFCFVLWASLLQAHDCRQKIQYVPELKVQVDIQRDSQTPVGMAQLEAVLHNESVCFPGLWLVCLPTAFSRHNGLSLLQHSLAYRITALWSQDEEDRPVAACCFMKCCMTSSKRATDFSLLFFLPFFPLKMQPV